MSNDKPWRYSVARLGDAIALVVIAWASLITSLIGWIKGAYAVSVMWWIAAVVLVVLVKRALKKVEDES